MVTCPRARRIFVTALAGSLAAVWALCWDPLKARPSLCLGSHPHHPARTPIPMVKSGVEQGWGVLGQALTAASLPLQWLTTTWRTP